MDARVARSTSRARVLVIAFGVVYALFLFAFLRERQIVVAHDDAFITYTYSRNLAQGDGLVFQSDERVWGFTSPAHTLSLSALAFAGIPPTSAAPALGITCAMLSGLLIFEILRRLLLQSLLPVLAASVLMTTTPLFFSFSTLEGNLLICCQLLALLLLLVNAPRSGALVAGISCLVRPDSIVLFAPMAFLERRPLIRPGNLVAFLAPGVAWLSFAAWYYGTIVPQPLFGKRGKTALLDYLVSSTYFGFGTAFPLEPKDKFMELGGWLLLAVKLTLVLLGWRLSRNRFRLPATLRYTLFVYPWALIAAYGVIGAPEHFWEIQSASFFFHLGLAFSVCALITTLSRAGQRSMEQTQPGKLIRSAAAPVAALVLVALNVTTTLRFFVDQQESHWRGAKYQAYLAAADWMNEHLPAGSRIAVSEIGILGYFAERYRIVDLAGLVTPTFGVRGFRGNRFILEEFEPDFALVPLDLAGPVYRGWPVESVHSFPEVAGVGPFELKKIVRSSDAS